MAYLLAATAAFVNALTSVLQRIGVETAPESTTLRWSLMAHALKRGIWLIGFALMLVQFGLQATALRFGELSVVQPVLTTELLFLLLILGVWFRYRLTWHGVARRRGHRGRARWVLPGGRAGRGERHPHQPRMAGGLGWCSSGPSPDSSSRPCYGPRWWRAAAFGAATAVTAAYSAALTKAITSYTTEGWGHVFTHFEPYMLAVTGLGTVFLIQNALHAGPITASRTTMVTINPLVSIVLGITLFADRLRSGPCWVALEIVALAVLVVGVVILARSPLVAGTQGVDDPDEMLGGARRRAADTLGVEPGSGPTSGRTRPGRPAVRCRWSAGRRPTERPIRSGPTSPPAPQPARESGRPWTKGRALDGPGQVEPAGPGQEAGDPEGDVARPGPASTGTARPSPGRRPRRCGDRSHDKPKWVQQSTSRALPCRPRWAWATARVSTVGIRPGTRSRPPARRHSARRKERSKLSTLWPDHHPARQPVGQVGMDGREGRGTGQHVGRDAVDVGGTGVAAGVDQGAEGPDLVTPRIEHHHPHFDDALDLGREPSGLHINRPRIPLCARLGHPRRPP